MAMLSCQEMLHGDNLDILDTLKRGILPSLKRAMSDLTALKKLLSSHFGHLKKRLYADSAVLKKKFIDTIACA